MSIMADMVIPIATTLGPRKESKEINSKKVPNPSNPHSNNAPSLKGTSIDPLDHMGTTPDICKDKVDIAELARIVEDKYPEVSADIQKIKISVKNLNANGSPSNILMQIGNYLLTALTKLLLADVTRMKEDYENSAKENLKALADAVTSPESFGEYDKISRSNLDLEGRARQVNTLIKIKMFNNNN